MEKFTIYTLEHPLTKEIKYIGYTKKKLEERLAMHFKNVKEAKLGKRKWNKRLSWISSLLNNNLLPVIQELEILNNRKEVIYFEIYWISQFINWGFSLTNMTNGGDGGDTFSSQSDFKKVIIKMKISDKVKGKSRSKESIEKFKEAIKAKGHFSLKPGYVNPNKGKTPSNETKAKMSLAKKGKKLSVEHRSNMCGKIPPNKNMSKYPPIIQLDNKDIVLNEFKSAGEAIKFLGFEVNRQSEIIRCCKGITKKAFKYKWQFKIMV